MKIINSLILISIFFYSCKKEQKTSSGIVVEFKNVTINLEKSLYRSAENYFSVHDEPILSYKTENNFKSNIIKSKKNFIKSIDEDKIFLRLRYSEGEQTHIFFRNDSVIINYRTNLPPEIKVINRKAKKYDYNFKSALDSINRIQPSQNLNFTFKNLNEKKEEHLLNVKKKQMETIELLENLKSSNLISDPIYEFKKKSIFYSITTISKRVPSSILVEEKGNLHVENYVAKLLIDSIYNNKKITPLYLKASNGLNYNYLKAFQWIKDNNFINDKTKEFLLWHCIQGVAKKFSLEDLQVCFNVFQNYSSDTILINQLKNKYLLDKIQSRKDVENVILIDLERNQTTLDNFIKNKSGKVIYIDFWASWCIPCRKTIPDSKKLIEKFKDRDIIFLYLSIDKNFDEWFIALQNENLKDYYYNKLVTNYPYASFFDKLSFESIPRYLIINKKGELVHRNAPPPNDKIIETILENYLNE